MSRSRSEHHLDRHIEAAHEEARRPLTRQDVAEVVASVMRGMDGGGPAGDLGLKAELEALNRFIRRARQEVSGIAPPGGRPMPATDDLDVLSADAAEMRGRVGDAVDSLRELAGRADPGSADALASVAAHLCEAAALADANRRRVAVLVRTLLHVGERISALVEPPVDGAPAHPVQAGGDAGDMHPDRPAAVPATIAGTSGFPVSTDP